MQLAVHVRPGASKPSIGGTHDGVLVVKVAAPAVDGRANEAVVRAVAAAVGVPPRSVTVVRGAASRRKVLEIVVPAGGAGTVTATLERLRAGGGTGTGAGG